MKRRSKTKSEEKFQQDLGRRIESLIKEKGYTSTYDFWIRKAGDDISRTTLNYIVTGKHDPKITTLRNIAKLLSIKLVDLLNIED